MNVSRRMQSNRMDQDRQKEFLREDLMKKNAMDGMLKANMSSDDRVENIRRTRRVQEENRAALTAKQLEETGRDRAARQRLAQQEEKLAAELEKRKNAKLCEEKFRQMVRENSVELRQLEDKLKAAYMSRERAAQIAEKRALTAAEKQLEVELVRKLEAEWGKYFASEAEFEKARAEKSQRYKAQLEEQLAEVEERKQQEYEEFLKEKLMVDDVVRKIYQEDEQEVLGRQAKQQETRRYVADFMVKRKEWLEQERRNRELEERRIAEYARVQREREAAAASSKKEAMAQRQDVYDRLAREMGEQERARQELIEIRTELYAEEQEHAARRKEKAHAEHLRRQRQELQDAHVAQVRQKAERRVQEQEHEQLFREEMARKFAEDERAEREREEERRRRTQQYKSEVEGLLAERKVAEARALEQEAEEREMEARFERYRQGIIEQERQRLLQEHAGNLIGHLPKGVLRDDKDLDLFNDEFKEQFVQSQKRVDPFESAY